MSEHRLTSVEIDAASLAAQSDDAEHERRVAIHDLLHDNEFRPAGASGGPYRLRLSLVSERLAFDIEGPNYRRTHLLSLSPLRSTLKDYLMICESYYRAIRDVSPSQIETLDMGRRGIHNAGSELLRERLAGKIDTDLETARRLFTLICALHWRPM